MVDIHFWLSWWPGAACASATARNFAFQSFQRKLRSNTSGFICRFWIRSYLKASKLCLNCVWIRFIARNGYFPVDIDEAMITDTNVVNTRFFYISRSISEKQVIRTCEFSVIRFGSVTCSNCNVSVISTSFFAWIFPFWPSQSLLKSPVETISKSMVSKHFSYSSKTSRGVSESIHQVLIKNDFALGFKILTVIISNSLLASNLLELCG